MKCHWLWTAVYVLSISPLLRSEDNRAGHRCGENGHPLQKKRVFISFLYEGSAKPSENQTPTARETDAQGKVEAIEAKRQRNAKIIVVDPRFTRTAATGDLFLQIRAGTDIAFLGGVINYALQNSRLAHDYLVNYTNAASL